MRIFILLLCLLHACAPSQHSDQNGTSQQFLPDLIKKEPLSSSLQTKPIKNSLNLIVEIPRKMIERPLFLGGTVLLQQNAPLSYFSRVQSVIFHASKEQLYLYEILPKIAYPNYGDKIFKQSFPILKEEEDSITVDFSSGLSQPSLTYAMGSPQTYNGVDLHTNILKTQAESADYQASQIKIKQSVQILVNAESFYGFLGSYSSPSSGQNQRTIHASLTSTFFLEPSSDIPSYLTEKNDLKTYSQRFFQHTIIRLNNSIMQNVPNYWNIEQYGPVEYRLDANAPVEIQKIFQESIAYWNRAAEQNIIYGRIGNFELDERLMPPLHTVQVDFIQPGIGAYSYADLEINPQTGQALRGHIHLLDIGLSLSLKEQLELFGHHRMLSPSHSCRPSLASLFIQDKKFKNNETETEDSKYNEEDIHHKIRLVLAHEIGHTLGLTHNFATHLDADLQKDTVASSVMGYLNEEDSENLGKTILEQSLPYDRETIQMIYPLKNSNSTLTTASSYAFCSDYEIYKTWIDCRPYSSGKDPIQTAIQKLDEQQPEFLFKLSLLLMLQDNVKDGLFKKSLLKNPDEVNKYYSLIYQSLLFLDGPILQNVQYILNALDSSSRRLESKNKYGDMITPYNIKNIYGDMKQDKKNIYQSLGGFMGLFEKIIPIYPHENLVKTNYISQNILHIMNETSPNKENTSGLLIADMGRQIEQHILRNTLLLFSGAPIDIFYYLDLNYNRAEKFEQKAILAKWIQEHQFYFFGEILEKEDNIKLQKMLKNIILNKPIPGDEKNPHPLSVRLAALRLLRPGYLPGAQKSLDEIQKSLAKTRINQNKQSIEYFCDAILSEGIQILNQVNFLGIYESNDFDAFLLKWMYPSLTHPLS